MCLMPYANNKGANQPALLCSLISTFVVRCLDSMIYILTCFIQSFKILASFFTWAGWFESYQVENPQRHVFTWCGSNDQRARDELILAIFGPHFRNLANTFFMIQYSADDLFFRWAGLQNNLVSSLILQQNQLYCNRYWTTFMSYKWASPFENGTYLTGK